MPRHRRAKHLALFVLFGGLVIGLLAVAGSLFRLAREKEEAQRVAGRTAAGPNGRAIEPTGTTGRGGAPRDRSVPTDSPVPSMSLPPVLPPPKPDEAIDELRGRHLLVPVDDVTAADLRPSFTQVRSQGEHEALDILAPRGTPVRAVEDGTIEKLFESKRGGLTVYQFDPTRRFAYYYAHLDRYARGLRDGQAVSRGALIGYVGTTGNAPPETPHLHFAIFILTPEKQWWEGAAVDPYLVWRDPVG
jgi:peptidoglycan LD-endopeptidase LytH